MSALVFAYGGNLLSIMLLLLLLFVLIVVVVVVVVVVMVDAYIVVTDLFLPLSLLNFNGLILA